MREITAANATDHLLHEIAIAYGLTWSPTHCAFFSIS